MNRELADALDAEHCADCHDQNTCDISKARSEGLLFWAAHLLMGATECPRTEAEYVKLAPSQQMLDDERFFSDARTSRVPSATRSCGPTRTRRAAIAWRK